MSDHDDDTHGATQIHASKGGGGGAAKWLLGAVGALVLAGGGFLAWQHFGQGQQAQSNAETQTAYNEPYAAEPGSAGPVEPSRDAMAQSATTDENAAPAAADTQTAAPARRSTARARARAVPEETIGITPISATTTESQDPGEIVVTARRPVWTRMPSARRLSAMYPERALERGREGEAQLHCVVQTGGALDCENVSATPGGFGMAALRVARSLRHSTQLADGRDATGTPVNLHVIFRMSEETRRG